MAPKLAYPAVIGRVHNLFHSATKVFRGDHRLWLQYLDFTLRSKSGQAAGKIFAEAIALHPTFVPFWITAASWEYFSNHNIHAARILLQRANRLNPQSKEILLEYCRLELAYREKVMQRLDVFGVGDSELKEAAVSMSDVPAGDSEQKGALEQVADSQAANSGKKQAANPFFSGAIPIAVFQAAIKASPTDFALRTQFAMIVNSFADTTVISDVIYASIEKDFAEKPQALAFVARRPYDNPAKAAVKPEPKKKSDAPQTEKASTFDLSEATNNCVSNFESQLSSSPSAELYELYTSFLQETLARVDASFDIAVETAGKKPEEKKDLDESLASFLRKKIVLVFKEAYANGFHSETLCSRWIDVLLALDRLEDALDASEKYTTALASNPLVHSYYFSLVGQLGEYHQMASKAAEAAKHADKKKKNDKSSESAAESDASPVISLDSFKSPKLKKFLNLRSEDVNQQLANVLRSGLDLSHPASGDLFILYWNKLLDTEENAQTPDEDERRPEESIALAAAMGHYKRTLATLRGAALEKFKQSTLRAAITRWNDRESPVDIARVRAVYEAGINSPPCTVSYYTLCINFETSVNTEQSAIISRRMFEAAVSDFGKKEKDIWLAYIEWETALGLHNNASLLFTRAKRTLTNSDDFISEYNRKRDEEFRAEFDEKVSAMEVDA